MKSEPLIYYKTSLVLFIFVELIWPVPVRLFPYDLDKYPTITSQSVLVKYVITVQVKNCI